ASDDNGNCVLTSAANPPDLYYGEYSDGILTVERAQKDGEDFSIRSKKTVGFPNFIKLASGALLLSEYGEFGRYIYRSDDKGHTWTRVYDSGSEQMNHYHTFGQLLETGRIVAFAGDEYFAKVFYSDDDGLSWSLLVKGEKAQPITVTDIGHPTKLLCGDDTNLAMSLFDLYTLETTPLFFDVDERINKGFVWTFTKNNGTIYASSFDGSSNPTEAVPVIYATDDLVNWSVIYRLSTANSRGATRLEFFNDALHGWESTGLAHINITPPPIGNRTGVSVEQTVSNEIPNEDRSSYEDMNWASYVSAPGAALSQIDLDTEGIDFIPHGDKAIRVIRERMIQTFYPIYSGGSYGVPISDGEIRSGSIMLGVPADGSQTAFTLRYSKYNGAESSGSSDAGGLINVIVQPGEWRNVSLPPVAVDSNDLALGLSVFAAVNNGKIDVLFDCAQITADGQQPSSWQVGGTPRASAAYDLNWQTQEKATHIFSFCPFAKSLDYDAYGNRQWYIRSWRVSSTIFANLYYDGNDQKFKLHVVNGEIIETLSTSAVAFKKGQSLIFVVRFGDENDAKAHLSVGHGRTVETVDGSTDFSVFALADILVKWGDADAAGGMNGKIYDHDLSGVLPADNIVDYVDSLISSGR
ncbi:MAG: glycoside hydrolase, partial [Phycisphaerae bacterium]|nr:glycoside hydrolase [Phycisphaerae bacterium]